jgi:PQQ-dependent catabolism-associated CXXCW motif protein
VVDPPPPRQPDQPPRPPDRPPPTTSEQPQPPQPADPMPQNFAEELTDFRVPPAQQIQGNLSSPTPTELPGAVGRVTTDTMRKLLASPEVNKVVLIDVLNSTTHQTIPGSIMVPGAGNAGSIGDGIQQAFARVLAQLTSDAGSESYRKPIVIYCASARCWESYNAGLRAIALGYRNVYWYRGGLESWRAAGGRLETSNVVVSLSASGPAPLQPQTPTNNVPRTQVPQTPPQPPPTSPVPQLIFPDSDRRLISEHETHPLSRDQIRIARNEIFARRGFRFRDQQLLDYFRRFPWYEPRATEVQLNLVEQANVRLLQSVEQRR